VAARLADEPLCSGGLAYAPTSRALWKILPQQPIGILVRPTLPRALRVAKIDIDVGRHRKAPMIRQLLAPGPGQGLIQLFW